MKREPRGAPLLAPLAPLSLGCVRKRLPTATLPSYLAGEGGSGGPRVAFSNAALRGIKHANARPIRALNDHRTLPCG